MVFFYVKAIHIVFVITWFSGMFYLGRLFVYNTEANLNPEPEKTILGKQFSLMIKRLLFGITWPSSLLTLIFGFWLLYIYNSVPSWLIIKLIFVALLFFYQISLHFIYSQQKKGSFRFSSFQLRIWNEVPTIFLISIVFLVVIKENLSWLYACLGLFGLIIILFSSIKIYKYFRTKKSN